MKINRNLWSADEVETLLKSVNESIEKGYSLWHSCIKASSELHRTAPACMLKYQLETDPQFREKRRARKRKITGVGQEDVITEEVTTQVESPPPAVTDDVKEVRLSFREIRIDSVTKELVIII